MTPTELIGIWSFTRTIADHRAGSGYRAQGRATFDALPDARIRWFEEGLLSWADGSNTFTRTLYLVPTGEGWSVTFEDGRFFHPWDSGDVVHLCGRDTYRGDVDSAATGTGPRENGCSEEWGLTWRVSGPEKDYTMTTRYRRLSG